ncbi:MAG: ATP-dependent helicase DeaD [Pseudomonadota bacterium]
MKNIDAAQDTQSNTDSSAAVVWSDFQSLPDALRKNLAGLGITAPTSIQAEAIPLALSGRDVLAQSRTGSGKTLAFTLPLALRLKRHGDLRALVLTPTRELATQVASVMESTVSALQLRTLAITGGSSYSRQRRALQDGVDIVVGTPGRINDLMTQGVLNLNKIEVFVLDEVDQMLDFGFAEDLEKIRSQLAPHAQTLFFSATLSSEIKALAKKTLKSPAEVNIAQSEGHSPTTIQHGYLEVRGSGEQKALINALLYHNPAQAIIFCKTRQECSDLSEALARRGFDAAALHGDLTQSERNQTMDKFREKKLKYLVATNVAARGIDVQDLPLVVNFNVPFDLESYTHRVGRTGRNGAEGEAWTIVTPSSCRSFEFLMRKLKLTPKPITVPTAAEVIHKSAESLMQTLKQSSEKNHSKTISKAVERNISSLEPEEKDVLLREFLARKLESLDVYYNDEFIVHKPFVRIGFESKFRERGEDGSERASRNGRPSRNFKGTGKPKFGESKFPRSGGKFKGKGGSGQPAFSGPRKPAGKKNPAH